MTRDQFEEMRRNTEKQLTKQLQALSRQVIYWQSLTYEDWLKENRHE